MNLAAHISASTGLPPKESEELLAISRRASFQKGENFIRAGEKPQKMGFTLSGLFRYLYIDDEGNEYTKAFMPEGSFLSSYSSMIQGEESYYSIEAMEDSVVLAFPYADWLLLKNSSPAWKDLLIKLLERGYAAKEKRERDLLLLSAETRYRQFVADFPTLEDRVKQKDIASYLGIKPESLSRIKKTLAT